MEFIQARAKEKGLGNVETVLATKENLVLPEKSLDLIFMRNVCHHLPERVEYFRKLQGSLGTDGRIAIVEYRGGEELIFRRWLGRFVQKEKIVGEMKKAGFQLQKDLDFLPAQSFTIYGLN